MKAAKRSLQAELRALQERAADLGLRQAECLGTYTPREIELVFRAEGARRNRWAQDADFLAWLVGRYVLLAVQAPRRFPKRPDAVIRRPRRMSDAEMKAAFAAMATERRERHGGD